MQRAPEFKRQREAKPLHKNLSKIMFARMFTISVRRCLSRRSSFTEQNPTGDFYYLCALIPLLVLLSLLPLINSIIYPTQKHFTV